MSTGIVVDVAKKSRVADDVLRDSHLMGDGVFSGCAVDDILTDSRVAFEPMTTRLVSSSRMLQRPSVHTIQRWLRKRILTMVSKHTFSSSVTRLSSMLLFLLAERFFHSGLSNFHWSETRRTPLSSGHRCRRSSTNSMRQKKRKRGRSRQRQTSSRWQHWKNPAGASRLAQVQRHEKTQKKARWVGELAALLEGTDTPM